MTGTVDKAFAKWMNGKELTFAALEVGTAPIRDVFNALRKDNWLHAHSKPTGTLAPAIKTEIRAAFYPTRRTGSARCGITAQRAWKQR